MEFIERIFDCFSYHYIITVILITYFVIGLWFNNKSETVKKVVTFCVGFVFAVAWYFISDLKLDVIFPSFAAAVVLYDYILKYFLRLMKITYDKLSDEPGKMNRKKEIDD